MVESRKLAALLSSLMSQLLLLLILLFSSSSFNSDSSYYRNVFPQIHHLLSSQEIAAALSLFSVSRKRKRTQYSEMESDSEEDEDLDGGRRARLGLTRSPDSYRNCFRMTSSTFEWLAGSLEPLLDCRDPVGFPLNLSAEQRLGIGLFRLATGSDYAGISKQFGVSETVARFCAKQLCRVLCTDFRFWVNFLNSNELESVSASFEERTGLPNCCGAISCARFKIIRNDDLPEDSISAQIVVDSSSRILSIVARFRGGRNDSRILKSSILCKDIEGGRLLNSPPVYVNGVAIDQYFVGDGRYPLLPWLIVPFVDAIPGSSEEYFNAAHKQIRLSASRTIVSLKNWGVLNQPIREEVKTLVAYVGACSILHNALLMREDYSALSDDLEAHTLYDRSSQDQRHNSLEDSSVDRKALVIRSALASRAKEFHNPNYQSNPRGSVQFQST
ncbi:hypothetical protein UlMin_042360 [Ulmus minor]